MKHDICMFCHDKHDNDEEKNDLDGGVIEDDCSFEIIIEQLFSEIDIDEKDYDSVEAVDFEDLEADAYNVWERKVKERIQVL